MAAIIRSFRNGITPITGASRDDLVSTDIVLLTAVDAHTTYSWVIAFAPAGSTATFSGVASASSPGTFTVDEEGSYLLKLTVDAGLGTEDEQYVRLRALTEFGELRLVAAGERRDGSGVIPVDVDVEGWANDQNSNIVTLKNFVQPLVSSGRLLYVDANDGTDSYADHDTVQAAIDAAESAGSSEAEQWIIAVRPGVYVEDITFKPWIHVFGWPGNPDGFTSEAVVLRTATGTGHVAALPGSDHVLISDLYMDGTGATANAVVQKVGTGQVRLHRCRIEQNGVSAGQGPAFDLQAGSARITNSALLHTSAGADDRAALWQTGASTFLFVRDSDILGPTAVSLNASLAVAQQADFLRTKIEGGSALGAGLVSSAQVLTVNGCIIEVPTGAAASAVLLHPSAGVLVGNMDATFKYSTIAGDIAYDTTGIAGTSDLNISALEYRATTFPGVAPTQSAVVKSKSHFYDNTISALIAENVQDAIDEIAALAAVAPVVYHKNMPGVPNDTVRYRGWAPVTSELLFVRVYIQAKNSSAGTYTLTVTNEATGNPCLLGTTFDMYSVGDATVVAVPLTATLSDLQFATQDAWTVELTSDDPGFDADSIYVSLVFNTATGSGSLVADWATTLAIGNITAGNNPTISTNDVMVFESSPAAPVSAATTGRVRYNQPTQTMQASLDGGAWEDLGGGGTPFIHKNVPVLPNNTFRYEGWAPVNGVVGAIRVYMDVKNTTGAYTATFTNEATGQTMLVGASFDMNSGSLIAGTPLSLTLTGTPADLNFAAEDQWSVEFASDNVGFDGSGIYFDILWGTSDSIVFSAVPDDDSQFEMTVSPGNTINTYFFAPYNLTIVAVKVYNHTGATTAGVYTLAVGDIDAANNLLSAATEDMTTGTLPAATLTSLALTGTAANLDLATGTRVRLQLVSDNGDLVGSGVYVQIIYRSQ